MAGESVWAVCKTSAGSLAPPPERDGGLTRTHETA